MEKQSLGACKKNQETRVVFRRPWAFKEISANVQSEKIGLNLATESLGVSPKSYKLAEPCMHRPDM